MFARRQREVVTGPAWVLDGNYASTLPLRLSAADVIVVLDLPAWRCLRGILARRLRTGGGQDPATGVYDRITAGLVRYVIGYRRHMRPRVRRLVAEHATGTVITLTSRRAVRRYLRTTPANDGERTRPTFDRPGLMWDDRDGIQPFRLVPVTGGGPDDQQVPCPRLPPRRGARSPLQPGQ